MSEVGDYDAITQLPELKVDELPLVSVEDVSFRFAHDQAERLYPYVDDAAHEWTGRKPHEITTRLHFNNAIRPGAFPDDWNKWWEALQDGAPKEMQHPLLGDLLVVVSGGDVQVSSRYRAGVVVTVNWRTTILDPEDTSAAEPLQLTLQEAAANADAAIGEIGVDFPSGYVATSFSEFLAQLDSFSLLIELQIAGVVGQCKQIVGQVHDLVTSEPDLSHARTNALDTLTQLYAVCLAVEERATLGARPTAAILTESQTTFDALVGETGSTLEDLMSLNIGALGSPVIPAGTMVKFYQ